MITYFITGTDTDCGKTTVTCELVRYCLKKNYRVCALKPVATGCSETNGQFLSEDAALLATAQGDLSYDIAPWRFKPAISPHLAAEAAGTFISLEALAKQCVVDSQSFDYVFIEGAGGLMVPLNTEYQTWLDFLIAYPLPVIMVVGMRLGCLNHALLTAAALRQAGVACIGWVANCLDETMEALPANIDTLKKALNLPLIAIMAHGGILLEPIEFPFSVNFK